MDNVSRYATFAQLEDFWVFGEDQTGGNKVSILAGNTVLTLSPTASDNFV